MVTIIAGPCSVDENNLNEVDEILSVEINGKRVIAGTRIVGLKSRTSYDKTGEGMGMDFEAFNHNVKLYLEGNSFEKMEDLPSVLMAKKIQDKYNCIIATEIMEPMVQMPIFDRILKGPLLPWNPAVNCLGWPISVVSQYCKKHDNWIQGFKNPKNLGITVEDSEINGFSAPMEKVWLGLSSYSQLPNDRKILIHRGVDSEVKSSFRNELVHQASMRTKGAQPGIKLFFDPSHSYGPNLRDEIVNGTIEAMKMKDYKGDFLYDGILIEVGTSITDTRQHITIPELKYLVKQLYEFRKF